MRHISTYLDDILIEDEELFDEEFLVQYGEKKFVKGFLCAILLAMAIKLFMIAIPTVVFCNEGYIPEATSTLVIACIPSK